MGNDCFSVLSVSSFLPECEMFVWAECGFRGGFGGGMNVRVCSVTMIDKPSAPCKQ